MLSTFKIVRVCDLRQISGAVALVLGLLAAASPLHCAEFAPIRFNYVTGGRIDYLLGYDRLNNSSVARQEYGLSVSGQVSAETYVVQPWLLRVGSHVKLSIGKMMMDQAPDNSWAMVRSNESRHQSITGGANLRLLAQSRFPLIAKFTRTDSRRRVGIFDTKELLDQLDITQSYTVRGGGAMLWAHYKRDRSLNTFFQVGHKELFSIRGGGRTKTYTMSLNFARSSEDSEIQPKSYADQLTVVHAYQGPEASLKTTANRHYASAGSEVVQYSTVGTWRARGTGLMVTGSIRLYDQFTAANNQRNSYTGANLGANYVVNKWLRLFGSLAVKDMNGDQAVSSTSVGNLAVSAQHHFHPLKLWRFDYTRFVGATIANSSRLLVESQVDSSSLGNSQAATARLEHGLMGQDVFSFGASARATQELYVNTQSQNKPQLQLSHNVTITKGIRQSSIRLSARDTRDLTGSRKFFQSLMLQGNQRESLSNFATIRGYVTVRAMRTGYSAESDPGTTSLNSSATLSYDNQRTFGVRDMFFTSMLNVMSSELSTESFEESLGARQGVYSWDSRLKYKIGKLGLEVRAVLSEVQSINTARFIFHASRIF
jgi:hypothetical protein